MRIVVVFFATGGGCGGMNGKGGGGVAELDKLYSKLKEIIKDGVEIQMTDKGKSSAVALVFVDDCRYFTRFNAETLEDALKKTVDKLLHPRKDYVDDKGMVWKANESSIYDAGHIMTFLANKNRKKGSKGGRRR